MTGKPYVISYNGHSSDEFGLRLLDNQLVWHSPPRTRVMTQVPDLSGDRPYSEDRYENVTESFPFQLNQIHGPLLIQHMAVSDWLQPVDDYMPLRFSLMPGYFMLAIPSGNGDLTREASWRGKKSLDFNCQPWAYDEQGAHYTDALTLFNPYQYAANPMIHIQGTGSVTVTVNGNDYVISDLTGDAYIDSETQETYDKDKTRIPGVALPNYSYPVLTPGMNTLAVSDTATEMEVMPRWRRLI